MAKKKIKRLNKDFYVTDEYGHNDKIVVQKINELIGNVNYQQEVIKSFELLMRDAKRRK